MLAKDFTLLNQDNESVSLSQFKGKKIVLYFYPKDFTPGCTAQACNYRDSFEEFKKRDTVVIGISDDSVEKHKKFQDEYQLKAQYLSDSDLEVCQLYGVYRKKTSFGVTKMGIVRTTFIIDENFEIVQVFDKVDAKSDTELVLKFIDEMK